MKIETFITWELRDKNRQLKSFSKEKGNSLVLNFIDILHVQMSQATMNLTDTGDLTKSVAPNARAFKADAASADATFGLVVGKGAGAVTMPQTKLVDKINNGNGQYQLAHGAMSFTAPTGAGSTRSFTLQRTFTNNYSSALTVTEVGIYTQAGGSTYYFMIDRALSTKTINPGTSGTLTYTLQVTV